MIQQWTRRGALRSLAGLGIGAAVVGCGSGGSGDDEIGTPLSCILTPEQVEGPFFLDTGLLRREIAEDRVGIPLRLELRLAAVAGESCEPLRGALVEAWHADADGVYSGYDRAQGNPRDAAGETFLRGHQVSDDRGAVRFSTIYPGWYPLRTVHIHLSVRLGSSRGTTTQIYFPEEINDAVLAQLPYAARGPRNTTNGNDFIAGPRLEDLICTVARNDDGYVARYALGIAV